MPLDDQSIGSLTSSASISPSSNPLLLGRRDAQDSRSDHFSVDGKLDELAIWDRALSSTEIASLYNNGNGLLMTPAATPEPASLTLLGLGALGLAGYGWRKRRQPVSG